ncbi:hypothetical protein NPIL_143921 [Nephila pilipes]|uniref:Spider venom protein n=1 Tax=Nephila pilipes TaxID=299642 RepID=A0A8X6T399_NEPPI|nr:hypothetical protein NPIL_143921 [Nephila pilipes]
MKNCLTYLALSVLMETLSVTATTCRVAAEATVDQQLSRGSYDSPCEARSQWILEVLQILNGIEKINVRRLINLYKSLLRFLGA